MSLSIYDQFVKQVLGLDLTEFRAGQHDDLDPAPRTDEMTPPPSPQPAAPPGDTPPTPEEQAWTAAAGTLATVEKQIKALDILGSAKAGGFTTDLAKAKQFATDGKPAEAKAALDTLAGLVKTEFDALRAPKTPTAAELTARKDEAKKMTNLAGHGTQADADLVVDQLAKMPKGLLESIEKQGYKVKVCQGSVTDYLTDLKGVQPRGWPAGMTWDNVPGLQRPSSKEVVIATIGQGSPSGAHVPQTGEGHGSANLVVHETAHGVDYAATPHISTTKPFTDARTPDVAALGPYETQADPAGPEETFAESCARFYSNDPSSAENTPHLHKYWRDNPLASG